MSIKILTSTLIDLNTFCQNPIVSLEEADKGILAILENNKPVMYAVTPKRLANLIKLEKLIIKPNDLVVNNNYKHLNNKHIFKPIGKYAMYNGWKPDIDFINKAAIWGITIKKPITESELAMFISYWLAEGSIYHHIQWQQKLARNLQTSRLYDNKIEKKHDIDKKILKVYHKIPKGFRG
ncbi:MAG: primosomal protein DnaT [Pantoea sp. Brub]|nr:primosomal protein DnaT [Pantoea sp. Brub]